jgi:glycosyltransferase involved in cell wall biosynthesis
VLLKAWKQLRSDIQLKIAGDGELAPMVRDAAASDPRIQFVGRLPTDQIYDLLGHAAALIFPSVWYEGLPKTILESYAKGTPVIASNLGSMSDVIVDGRTGAHFTSGNPADLARTITRLFASGELVAMRKSVREEFDTLYTGDANYRMLMDVYESVSQGAISRVL